MGPLKTKSDITKRKKKIKKKYVDFSLGICHTKTAGTSLKYAKSVISITLYGVNKRADSTQEGCKPIRLY